MTLLISKAQLKTQDFTLFKTSNNNCYSGSFDYNRKFECKKIDCPNFFDKSLASTTKKVKTKEQQIKKGQRKLKIIAYQNKLISLDYKVKVNGFLDKKTIRAH